MCEFLDPVSLVNSSFTSKALDVEESSAPTDSTCGVGLDSISVIFLFIVKTISEVG